MDTGYWLKKWKESDIAFHQEEYNPFLVEYFQALSLLQGSCVFLPLCGKTLDIVWLLEQGCRVKGVELSSIAIEQLFDELKVTANVSIDKGVKRYSSQNIDIWVGDFFEVTTDLIGAVDAIYDRAALVALPETLRSQYTQHLMSITRLAPQLLLCYEYDQSLMEGPPFSITETEVHNHYSMHYEVNHIKTISLPEKLKDQCEAREHVWLLSNNTRV